MTMKIAFTGTRRGMDSKQAHELRVLLETFARSPWSFHTGGARGADRQAEVIAHELGCTDIHVWLPKDATYELHDFPVTVHHTDLPPLVRNHLIIADAAQVYATPAQEHEVLRSGTWATVRYARKAGQWTYVISPNTELVG